MYETNIERHIVKWTKCQRIKVCLDTNCSITIVKWTKNVSDKKKKSRDKFLKENFPQNNILRECRIGKMSFGQNVS